MFVKKQCSRNKRKQMKVLIFYMYEYQSAISANLRISEYSPIFLNN